MMMWQISGGTCAAPRSPPVESNANPIFLHALVNGRELRKATQPPHHHPFLLQHLKHPPQPLRNGAMQVATGSGNAAGHAFLTCVSRTPTPDPTRRKNLGKFFHSTRRRGRTSTFEPVWKCGRILHQWYIQLMGLRDARPRMPRGGLLPTWQVSGNADIPRWCTI